MSSSFILKSSLPYSKFDVLNQLVNRLSRDKDPVDVDRERKTRKQNINSPSTQSTLGIKNESKRKVIPMEAETIFKITAVERKCLVPSGQLGIGPASHAHCYPDKYY